MEISEIGFEAFKSLYNVTCELDHFTVITGPNGAGKSNFSDALNFIGEVYADGLEFAVSHAGGYENISHRRTRRAKKPIRVAVKARIARNDILRSVGHHLKVSDDNVLKKLSPHYHLNYEHEFSIATSTQRILSDFTVIEDRVTISDRPDQHLVRLTRDPEGKVFISATREARNDSLIRDLLDPFTDVRFANFIRERPLQKEQLLTEVFLYGTLARQIQRSISGIGVFQLSSYQCRASGVATPNATLGRHGDNLPGAAFHLSRNDPHAWSQVEQAMRTIMPGLEGIHVAATEDRRLALQFRESGIGRPWNSSEVSDGTIQSLALFIALFDRRNPLLVVEEPENSIHPWILRHFVDLCRESVDKQIVVTTHSPVLLNYVDPRIVRLAYSAKGRTQIVPIMSVSASIRELILSGDIGLFDLYDSGMLPVAVPNGFSPLDGGRVEGEEG